VSPLRRPLLLALGSLLVAGLGLHDWPVDAGRATAVAVRALDEAGLALSAQGPARLTLLPLPRLSIGQVRLAAGTAGPPLAEGARLIIEFDPVGLLVGRARAGGLRLEEASLVPDPVGWRGPLTRLSEQVRSGAAGALRRITLSHARVADGGAARDIDLDLTWPFWSGSAEARASLTWQGVPARIALTHLRPSAFAQAGRSPFTAAATWPGGSLAAEGTVTLPADGAAMPVLAGQARVETRSLPETLAWLGHAAPLSPLVEAFSIDGRFETADRSVSWPSLRLGLGQNVLEGAGAVSFGHQSAPRVSVQATLAAETLDLAPLLDDLTRLFQPGQEPVPLALGPFTRGDLDLRLSAADVRLDRARVQDLAASVLIRDAALEIAVNRARVQDGLVKGRVMLAAGADPAETELRTQGSLDRVDLGSLLGPVGPGRWLGGPLNGQFAFESSARDSVDLLAHLGGRMALAVEGGVLSGLDLADVIHRNGAVAAGALARRNGRTVFERAAVALRFTDGIGEIAEAGLRGPSVSAALRGRISLPDRRLDARGDLALRPPGDPTRGVQFEIAGPWEALSAQTVARGEAGEPAGEAMLPEPLKLPAALGLSGNARAYAP
jgi:AsmA protein